MSPLQAAIYARVSSERQAETHTIASQLAALRARVAQDGLVLSEEVQFIDEGYSGATLVRPGLERMRDLAAAGALDRLYVHSPDRLARKYAYQVLLLDELHRAGVEVVFLNRELGRTPEDDLLLQVQGMMAEYERAKIIERHRRGKLHRARAGSVNVLGGAPYGYRYITKVAGGGQARYEIVADEAHVVRQVFEWVGVHRLSIGAVCRRLNHAGERTCTGKTTWDRSVVWAMLKNPAYMGQAAFGKTHVVPRHPPLRPHRRRRDQLRENRAHARQRLRGVKYLLQGLICCKRCGYAYYGKAISFKAAKGHPPRLRLLSVPGDGRLSVWGGARVSQHASAHGSGGLGRVGSCVRAVEAPGAVECGIPAPAAPAYTGARRGADPAQRATREVAAGPRALDR